MPLLSSSSGSSSAGSGDLLPSSAPDELLLLCAEDAAAAFSEDPSPPVADDDGEAEAVALALAQGGGNHSPCSGHVPALIDADSRRRSVEWVLKVCAYYDFQPLTAYLAVSYMDRFLSCHSIPQLSEGWPMQLLSVACLSLAAKLEETQVPALLDLQVEGAKFVFEPQTVCRMEILLLSALNWRLRYSTPFSFLDFFARKADAPPSMNIKYLTKHASLVILEILRDIEFSEYLPSTIAAAALVYVSDTVADRSFISPDVACSWCPGLIKDEILNCYQFMHGSIKIDNKGRKKLRIQQDSSYKTSPSSPSSPANKRRKLNNCPSTEDDIDES